MTILLKKLNFKTIINTSVLFVLIIASQTAIAQSSKKMLEEFKKKYPDAPYVTLNKSEITSINLVNGDIEITEKITEENFYLEGDVSYLADDKIRFSDFVKIGDVKAASYLPKGNRFITKKVKDFDVQTEFSRGIFHNDAKSLNFTYPALQKGAKSSLSYSTTITEPRFLGGFYFINQVPVLKQKYVLEVHPDIDIDIKEFNTKGADYKYEKTLKGGKNIHTWLVNSAPKISFERGIPNYKYFVPHVIPHITHYKVNGERKNLLADVNDLFEWYTSLIKNVNAEIDEEAITNLVNEITKDASDDLEKVRKIFYWTQDHIKYIAFEEGMNGFIPRNADKVVDQKYGDCKDMSNCISTLLKYAEVPASLCWIGTDELPYTYEELPTPAIDNHMIAAYKANNEYYFLDATSPYISFGTPSIFIQGQEALIQKGDKFEIVKVPYVEAEKNSQVEISTLKIEENQLTGSSTKSYAGYYKTELIHDVAGKNKSDKFKFWRESLKKGSNKFVLKDLNVLDELEKEKPTVVEYTFKIDDYIFKNDNEIYINLNMYDWFSSGKLENDRKLPYRVRFKTNKNITHQLEIPDGYDIAYLPENIELNSDLYTYNSTYEVTNDKIIHNEVMLLKYIQLQKEDFNAYNNFIDAIDEAESKSIVLKKK